MSRLPTILVGREQSLCDLTLGHSSVSRVHAEIQLLAGGDLYVTDCHSSAGTRVTDADGQRAIRQGRVTRDAVLLLGEEQVPAEEIARFIERRRPPGLTPHRPPPVSPGAAPDILSPVRCPSCRAIKSSGQACPTCGHRTRIEP